MDLKEQIISLSKYLACMGVCSRRRAVDLIKAGVVTINNILITEPGHKVDPSDIVHVRGKKLTHQKKIYIVLNKPKNYITTISDEANRRTVIELIKPAIKQRVYSVGRLDRNTTGLLLLTNDGDLAQKLAHPRYNIQKEYHVTLDRPLRSADMSKIKEGVKLSDGLVKPDAISYAQSNGKYQVRLALHSGKNRIIRRLFEALGYKVKALDRIMYAGLPKRGLAIGQWRFLTDKEIIKMKQ